MLAWWVALLLSMPPFSTLDLVMDAANIWTLKSVVYWSINLSILSFLSQRAISGSKISFERWTTQWFQCCAHVIANVIFRYWLFHTKWIQMWSRFSMRTHWKSLGRSAHLLETCRTNHNSCNWWFTMQTKTITQVNLHVRTYTPNKSYTIIQEPIKTQEVYLYPDLLAQSLQCVPTLKSLSFPYATISICPQRGDDSIVTWHTERMYKWQKAAVAHLLLWRSSLFPPGYAIKHGYAAGEVWGNTWRLAMLLVVPGASYLVVPPFPPMTSFSTQQYSLGKSCASIAKDTKGMKLHHFWSRYQSQNSNEFIAMQGMVNEHVTMNICKYICVYIYIFICLYHYSQLYPYMCHIKALVMLPKSWRLVPILRIPARSQGFQWRSPA